jgi:uncharacterized sporulation protein YeaH/YhbH (DUF444 family)
MESDIVVQNIHRREESGDIELKQKRRRLKKQGNDSLFVKVQQQPEKVKRRRLKPSSPTEKL